MNASNKPQATFRKGTLYIVFLPMLVLLAALVLASIQQAQAGFNCSGNSWNVATEPDINSAIVCYNSQTTPDNYTITFTQNINLTGSTTPISNSASNVALIINGAGFTIDGQSIEGIRPFMINHNTLVSMQTITITGSLNGAILNTGNLTITNSTLKNNSAYFGGGIYNWAGTLIINNTTFNSNSADSAGGGIYNFLGHITLSNSTLSANSSKINGGGIYTEGTAILSNSTFSNNSAGNGGGGIIVNEGTVTISNNTFSNNSAVSGGGIFNFLGTISLDNNIIANSISGSDCTNSGGTVTNNGHNIVGDNNCGFTGGSNPMLAPLQDNGGSTFTHALFPGSPAIDQGDTTLTTDQRGVPRPQGLADDIGAFESSIVFSDFIYLPIISNQ